MIKPVSPEEISPASAFPDSVIEVWNTLINRNYRNGKSKIYQEEAAQALAAAHSCSETYVYDQGWLDIEEMYRKAGWRVEYDRPAYNENYRAVFYFEKK